MKRACVTGIVAFALLAPEAPARPTDFLPGASIGMYGAGAVTIGDWNGDGKADVAAYTIEDEQHTAILLGGKGAGLRAATPLDTRAAEIVSGDFDGDGDADVLIRPGESASPGAPEAPLLMFAGHGDGTFDGPRSGPAGSGHGASLVSGDFDGDGRLDAALASRAQQVLLLRGDGGGALQEPVTYDVGAPVYGMAAANLDGDPATELAVSIYTGSRTTQAIRVLDGTAAGTLTAAGQLAFPNCRSRPVTADLDRDGLVDLACTGAYRLRRGGGFGPVHSVPRSNGFVALSTVGDVTGDKRPDLLATGGEVFSVARSLARGGWSPFHPYWAVPSVSAINEGGFAVSAVEVGDLVGDTRLDALVRTWDEALLFRAVELRRGRCANRVRGGFVQIDGTELGDLMSAPTLHTYMRGRAGDDCLFASERSSKLFGDADDDVLRGGPATDRLSGGTGDDRIYATGGGRDNIDCGPGRDFATADRSDRVRRCERVVYAR